MSADQSGAPSVFGVPDQAEVIARIDSVDDDDLTSSFFGDSIDEVEGAATRMFDIGIRAVTGEAPPSAEAFGRTTPSAGPAAEATASALFPGLPAALEDPAARRAFILGGPGALTR